MIKIINKYHKMPIEAKAALWFVFANLLDKALAFITTPIFTHIMIPEQYGIYSTYLSWCSILEIFLTLRLGRGAYTNVLGKERNIEQCKNMTLSLITLGVCITTGALLIFLCFWDTIIKWTGLSSEFLILIFLQIYSSPVISFWIIQKRFDYRYKLVTAYSILTTLVNVTIGILLVCFGPTEMQAFGRVFSSIPTKIIVGIVLYIYIVKKTHKFYSFEKWKETLFFQLPLIPHYLSMTVLFSSDRIMISKLIGSAEAGIYGLAYTVSQVIDILKACIVDAMRPWIYKKLNGREYKEVSRFSFLIIGAVAIVSALYASIAPELLCFIAPAEYYSAIYVIPPITISAIFTFFYDLLMVVETYYGRTLKIMGASVLAAGINIGLNFILIPIFGFVAAGYTTMASYLILSVFHYHTVRCIEKTELHGKRIVSAKGIALIMCLGFLSCFGISTLYNYRIIRYMLIFIFILSSFSERKNILEYYKMLKEK